MVKSILLIDDCEDFRSIASSLLLDAGYDVWEAGSPAEAYPILKHEKFDLIICDLHMPFTEGIDAGEYVVSYEVGLRTVQELSEIFPTVPVIALSNTASTDLERIQKYLSPVPAYTKPIHNDEILAIVKRSLEIQPQKVFQ